MTPQEPLRLPTGELIFPSQAVRPFGPLVFLRSLFEEEFFSFGLALFLFLSTIWFLGS